MLACPKNAYSDKFNVNRSRCGGKSTYVRESRRMKIKAEFDEVKYAAILSQYQPRPIHTEKDNQRAMDILEGLNANGELTPELEALAEILTTLIENFEDGRYALSHRATATRSNPASRPHA